MSLPEDTASDSPQSERAAVVAVLCNEMRGGLTLKLERIAGRCATLEATSELTGVQLEAEACAADARAAADELRQLVRFARQEDGEPARRSEVFRLRVERCEACTGNRLVSDREAQLAADHLHSLAGCLSAISGWSDSLAEEAAAGEVELAAPLRGIARALGYGRTLVQQLQPIAGARADLTEASVDQILQSQLTALHGIASSRNGRTDALSLSIDRGGGLRARELLLQRSLFALIAAGRDTVKRRSPIAATLNATGDTATLLLRFQGKAPKDNARWIFAELLDGRNGEFLARESKDGDAGRELGLTWKASSPFGS